MRMFSDTLSSDVNKFLLKLKSMNQVCETLMKEPSMDKTDTYLKLASENKAECKRLITECKSAIAYAESLEVKAEFLHKFVESLQIADRGIGVIIEALHTTRSLMNEFNTRTIH